MAAPPALRRWGGVLLLLAAVCGGCAPPPGTVTLPPAPDADVRVWVVGVSWHAAIIVEQPEGWALGPPGREDAPFVEFAWGDRRWYMEERYGWVLATLFWPTESVMFVRAWGRPPAREDGFHTIYERRLSSEAFHALMESVEGDFVRTEGGGRADPHPPLEGRSGRFYPARRPYVIWDNSNAWVVRRLRAAGVARGGGLPVVFVRQVPGRLVGFEEQGGGGG